MKSRGTLLLTAALLCAGPVGAKSLKSVPPQFDPNKAYVLVELEPAEDSKGPAQLVFARYDQAKADVRGLGRAKDAPLPSGMTPRESTGAALVKADARRLYLLEVEPDFWIVEGANGTAFSLGSAGVALAPGTITDLGVAVVANDYLDGDGPQKMTAGKLAKLALLGPFAGGGAKQKPTPATVTFRPRTDGDLPVPDALRSKIVPASWSGPVKFGNYLGGLVNRMGGRKARDGAASAAPAPVAVELPTAASNPGS